MQFSEQTKCERTNRCSLMKKGFLFIIKPSESIGRIRNFSMFVFAIFQALHKVGKASWKNSMNNQVMDCSKANYQFLSLFPIKFHIALQTRAHVLYCKSRIQVTTSYLSSFSPQTRNLKGRMSHNSSLYSEDTAQCLSK